jgi:hypothetical protein
MASSSVNFAEDNFFTDDASNKNGNNSADQPPSVQVPSTFSSSQTQNIALSTSTTQEKLYISETQSQIYDDVNESDTTNAINYAELIESQSELFKQIYAKSNNSAHFDVCAKLEELVNSSMYYGFNFTFINYLKNQS